MRKGRLPRLPIGIAGAGSGITRERFKSTHCQPCTQVPISHDTYGSLPILQASSQTTFEIDASPILQKTALALYVLPSPIGSTAPYIISYHRQSVLGNEHHDTIYITTAVVQVNEGPL